MPDKILLGLGVVAIDSVPIGLTRGGSTFNIERAFRQIPADGDKGPIKGRIVSDGETAKLVINALELFTAAEMVKYFPATAVAEGVTADTWTGTLEVLSSDYHTVTWTGKTLDGESLVIELQNAINIDNVEFKLEDKNEVVPALTYTATYLEDARTTPPWNVKFGKATAYAVTLTITSDGSTPIVAAEVTIGGIAKSTNASGVAAFTIAAGTNIQFTVVKGGYETYYGAIDVSGITAETVTMTAIA